MALKHKSCSHLDNFELRQHDTFQCDKCVKTGDGWVHLRTCQSCGTTLCCDSSVNQHARKHFNETGHEVIISAEEGEYWAWCYVDELYRKYR